MLKKRGFAVIAVAFAVLLIGGVAMAGVGPWGPDDVGDDTAAATALAGGQAGQTQATAETGDEARQVGAEPSGGDERTAGDEGDRGDGDGDDDGDAAPRIEILRPEHGAHVDSKVIVVSGKVELPATVAVADHHATVDDSGHWWARVELEGGRNRIVAVATAPDGTMSRDHVVVFYDETHEFIAHQKYEVVDGENPVVNFYWGTGRPGAEVHVGSEYGRGATKVNDAGVWELRVAFEAPCNQSFRVAAESGDARVGFEMERVCRVGHEFTAHQKYGSCGEPIPFDVFYGTGTPGARVVVESPYGSGRVTIDERGKWEVRVEFPDAPIGDEFRVVVESSDGGRAVFGFVATGGEHG
jgi:hypothetical protein